MKDFFFFTSDILRNEEIYIFITITNNYPIKACLRNALFHQLKTTYFLFMYSFSL